MKPMRTIAGLFAAAIGCAWLAVWFVSRDNTVPPDRDARSPAVTGAVPSAPAAGARAAESASAPPEVVAAPPAPPPMFSGADPRPRPDAVLPIRSLAETHPTYKGEAAPAAANSPAPPSFAGPNSDAAPRPADSAPGADVPVYQGAPMVITPPPENVTVTRLPPGNEKSPTPIPAPPLPPRSIPADKP
jgi:hypothetical protein